MSRKIILTIILIIVDLLALLSAFRQPKSLIVTRQMASNPPMIAGEPMLASIDFADQFYSFSSRQKPRAFGWNSLSRQHTLHQCAATNEPI